MNVAVNPAVPGLEDPVPPQYVQGVWLLKDAPFGPDARALNPVGGANETCDGAANSARRQSRLTDAVGNALGTDNILSSQVDYDATVDAVPQFAEKLCFDYAPACVRRVRAGRKRKRRSRCGALPSCALTLCPACARKVRARQQKEKKSASCGPARRITPL